MVANEIVLQPNKVQGSVTTVSATRPHRERPVCAIIARAFRSSPTYGVLDKGLSRNAFNSNAVDRGKSSGR